jgi:hypothetical protein
MAEQDNQPTVVPIPDSSAEQEHDRIRRSSDRDQALEREGRMSEHNRGYDEAADGKARPETSDSEDGS